MPYVILCYRDERVKDAACRTAEQIASGEMSSLVNELVASGAVDVAVKLLGTTTSTTLRLLRGASLVLDGPANETGIQLQSFYLVDCATLDDALAIAGAFAEIEPGGVYEVRPVAEVVSLIPFGRSHGRG